MEENQKIQTEDNLKKIQMEDKKVKWKTIQKTQNWRQTQKIQILSSMNDPFTYVVGEAVSVTS